ncbi:MAG: DUF58 domain-containing protein [Blastocatellia bacterium]|nr:DUF58 domain-containing protein [Blastocatellia bacterium]
MKFVFTARFFILLAAGILLLSAGWVNRAAFTLIILYDVALITFAVIDYIVSESASSFQVEREMEDRFAMGAENRVTIKITNRAPRPVTFRIKDEYPPDMELLSPREVYLTVPAGRSRMWSYNLLPTMRGSYSFGNTAVRFRSRLGLLWRQVHYPTASGSLKTAVKVYPDIREAKKNELYAHRNRRPDPGLRRMRLRGHGREFESLRDFVIGDEIRHISWAATARRGKLITRQYTIERSQNVVVMLDTGRLMTARIGKLSKLDHAINAALSIAYVAASGGDNVGLVAFSRRVISYLPPHRGHDQINRLMEALYKIEPQMIEPSYARAFNFFSTNCHRRSLVVILTDLVDRDASAELLAHTSKLVPRHLPLIVTIGDTDLRELVRANPDTSADVYRQSVAEEILRQREEALSRIRHAGGLALDVPARHLSLELVNKYLEVKERGLL